MQFINEPRLNPTQEQIDQLVNAHKEMIELTGSKSCDGSSCSSWQSRPTRCCKTLCNGYYGLFRMENITLPILNNMSIDELNIKLTSIYNDGGFWKDGCKLPREMRPFLCIQYYCDQEKSKFTPEFRKKFRGIHDKLNKLLM